MVWAAGMWRQVRSTSTVEGGRRWRWHLVEGVEGPAIQIEARLSIGCEEETRLEGLRCFTDGGELGRPAMARRPRFLTEDSACASARRRGSSDACKGSVPGALAALK
jgi:hypothetical protein